MTSSARRVLLDLIELGWGTQNADLRQVFAAKFVPGGSAEQWRWFTEKMRLSTSPRNAAQLFRETNRMDVRDLACEVRRPTLVLHARDDALVPYDEGKLTAALIPGAEFVTLDSANPVILEDEPAWKQVVRGQRPYRTARDRRPAAAADHLRRIEAARGADARHRGAETGRFFSLINETFSESGRRRCAGSRRWRMPSALRWSGRYRHALNARDSDLGRFFFRQPGAAAQRGHLVGALPARTPAPRARSGRRPRSSRRSAAAGRASG